MKNKIAVIVVFGLLLPGFNLYYLFSVAPFSLLDLRLIASIFHAIMSVLFVMIYLFNEKKSIVVYWLVCVFGIACRVYFDSFLDGRIVLLDLIAQTTVTFMFFVGFKIFFMDNQMVRKDDSGIEEKITGH